MLNVPTEKKTTADFSRRSSMIQQKALGSNKFWRQTGSLRICSTIEMA
jgi:hypothetical protein